VESDMSIAERLRDRLIGIGYLVETAITGRQALETLESKWFDLIILAVGLRGSMDGYQLLKEIQQRRRLTRIPVIVQSNKPSMRAHFAALGIRRFFVKPYPIGALLKEAIDALSE